MSVFLKKYLNTKIILYVLSTLILLKATNIYLAAIILSLFLSYKILCTILDKDIFKSTTFVLVLTPFFYALLLECIILISWILSRDIPLTSTILFILPILLLVYYSIAKRRISRDNTNRPLFVLTDIATLTSLLVVFIAIVITPIFNSGFDKTSSLMVLVNNSVDDASHLGLLNDRIQFNRGVIEGSDAAGLTRSDSISFYPAGWHSANAAIIKSIIPNIKTGTQTLVAYTVSKVFWFFLLVFVFVRTIFSLYSIYSKREPSLPSTVIMLCFSLLFIFFFLVDSFSQGFYSFLPQLIIVPLFILSLIQLSLTKSTVEDKIHYPLVLPILLCAGSALSWLLLFPVFAFALTITILNKVKYDNTKLLLKRYLHEFDFVFLIYAMSVVAVLTQVYISTQSSSGVSFTEGIILKGGIVMYPPSFYIFVLVGIVLFFTSNITLKAHKITKPIVYYLFAALLFASIVYVIQLYLTQSNEYYYFKVLGVFTLSAIILSIVGLGLGLERIGRETSRSYALMLGFVIFFISLQFSYQNAPIFGYIRGTRATTSSTNEQVWNTLDTSYTQENYYNKEVRVYYPENNPALNEVGSMLLKSNKPYSDCFQEIKRASYEVPPSAYWITPILLHCNETSIKITYYTNPPFVKSMKHTINNTGLQDRVFIKPISN